MKKTWAALAAIGVTVLTVAVVVACAATDKLKKVDIEEFKAKVEIETNQKHEFINEAIDEIKAIALPEGIDKIEISTNGNDIKIVFFAKQGYKEPCSIVITFEPIKTPKIKITTEEIQNNADLKAISNLDNLQAVNEKLASIKITGVDSLAATASDGSATDVTVTITINEETHILEGDSTFVITGAIKTPKVKITTEEIKKAVG
ncbi:hypothetical protein, partial [Mesoplasma seiffertii]|uniref:hypothetical protein n=1 Tax=Mesoplasma seiffertii TaxID=28224 RepID=UPI00047E004A